MKKSEVIHSTFVLERHYPVSPERVFAAMSDPRLKRRWFADGGHNEVVEYSMDFRAGGAERLVYKLGASSPYPGAVISSDGHIESIVENKRVVSSATMTFGTAHISTAIATLELRPNGTGTDLICTHQAVFFENSDGPQLREQGWVKILDKLGESLAA
jgi:uncharacterized protein YndB with AHSA1/START domain